MASHRSRSSSASEGEILESGSNTEANISHTSVKGSSVDRRTRATNSPSYRRSPSISYSSRHERSPSRSPPRYSRGEKRRYDDYDHYEPERSRRMRYDRRDSRYDRGGRDYDRPRDRGYGRRPRAQYHDYDSYTPGGRAPRSARSRSPYKDPRRPKRYSDDEDERDAGRTAPRNGTANGDRVAEDASKRKAVEQSVSERSIPPSVAPTLRKETEPSTTQAKHVAFSNETKPSDDAKPSAAVAEDTTNNEPVDEAALIEERRKRREAILAKYRQQQQPEQQQSEQQQAEQPAQQPAQQQQDIPLPSTEVSQPSSVTEESKASDSAAQDTQASPDSHKDFSSRRQSPVEFNVLVDGDLANNAAKTATDEADGPSAVDYNPMHDMEEDKLKHDAKRFASGLPSQAYDETKTGKQEIPIPQPSVKQPKKSQIFDMFAEDEDEDMDVPITQPVAAAMNQPPGQELDVSMMDNWDDPQGYYNVMLGEIFGGRYHVTQNLGRGMFSNVVRATDSQTGSIVAIKIIRNNDTMRKAAQKEIEILQQLQTADPQDKKHIIRLERTFDHKGHFCIVFENLSMNLREVLKKFGRDVGINLKAIRVYAQQLFLGLSLLQKCGIIHADLKPDNLLVNEGRNVLKICDLGSASPVSENEITPYLVSRFYRAPEIILGLPYDCAADVWSVGCTLYELYTGKILFTGRNNNQMLRSMMECRGQFPPKLLRRGVLSGQHFDDMLNFHSVEEDSITGRVVTRVMTFKKPKKDLKARLTGTGATRMDDANTKELTLFIDLLDKCLSLNPEKRCTPLEALKHPFIHRSKI